MPDSPPDVSPPGAQRKPSVAGDASAGKAERASGFPSEIAIMQKCWSGFLFQLM
jgi:hypothetical protein